MESMQATKSIEDEIFFKCVPCFQKIESFGFEKKGDIYEKKIDFLQSDFCASVMILPNGKVQSKVIDNMNGCEYTAVKSPNRNSPYICQVRKELCNILQQIADACFSRILFSNRQANEIVNLIEKTYEEKYDFPFTKEPYKDCIAFRHKENKKWYALFMTVAKNKIDESLDGTMVDIVNMKIDAKEASELFCQKGVYPAYHMNHKQWASLFLDDSLSNDFIMKQVEKSFLLTK